MASFWVYWSVYRDMYEFLIDSGGILGDSELSTSFLLRGRLHSVIIPLPISTVASLFSASS